MAFVLPMFSYFEDPLETDEPLIKILNRFTSYASLSSVILTWCVNWTGRQKLQLLFNEFATIESDYFCRYKHLVNECAIFDCYLLWKGFAIVLQNTSYIYTTTLAVNAGWIFFLWMCLMALLTNVIFLVLAHFFLAVLYTYRFIWVLNRRLQTIADIEVQRRHCRLLVVEIDTIASIYLRLIRLCEAYTRIHQFQLLLVVACVTACNIEVLFYIRLLWSGKTFALNAANVLAVAQIFFVNVLDFWLTITICELAVVTSRTTLEILRGFSEKTELAIPVERSLESFTIICCSKKLQFHLCGLFDINHLSGLKVLMTMILYLIYLVQYHNENE
ncbi:gustatory receptor for bitter taste 22e-like [Anastrepha ludens]|uniref:gustatory receptor for bitter taste 22e-like n=1 Tax=Anastrepha ludens TaxID=28586 RepID=UPI0023B100E7|nr:gustatory receptor for bitter taste 22e-like [Anastrepha ludens]